MTQPAKCRWSRKCTETADVRREIFGDNAREHFPATRGYMIQNAVAFLAFNVHFPVESFRWQVAHVADSSFKRPPAEIKRETMSGFYCPEVFWEQENYLVTNYLVPIKR